LILGEDYTLVYLIPQQYRNLAMKQACCNELPQGNPLATVTFPAVESLTLATVESSILDGASQAADVDNPPP
jgi:hypothetical protein